MQLGPSQVRRPARCHKHGDCVGIVRGIDTNIISLALQSTSCLCSLTLSNSQIDDDTIRLLVEGFDRCCSTDIKNTLIYLDVSHNKITTDGIRLLANYFLEEECSNESEGDIDNKKILRGGAVLASFNAGDNCIHAEGGRTLGRLLRNNNSLINLNLCLNRLGDAGGGFIIEGLQHNNTLKVLNLASNCLASRSVAALSTVLMGSNEVSNINLNSDINKIPDSSNRIESINISSNICSMNDMTMLASAVQYTNHLVALDVRQNCGVDITSKDAVQALTSINKKLYQNENNI